MTREPDFNELVGEDLPAAETERLRRAHDHLLAAGPLPELPPGLAEPSLGERRTRQDENVYQLLPKRRTGAALAIAAAIALVAFLGGYLSGYRHNGFTAQYSVPMHASAGLAGSAQIKIGERDSHGNLPLRLEVKGLPKRRRQEAVDHSLFRAGLLDVRARIIGNLSKGYRQRVGLAQALLGDPPVVILDEPMSGLDPLGRREVRGRVDRHEGAAWQACARADRPDHLRCDAAVLDERGVRDRHLLGEEPLAGLGVAADLSLSGLRGAQRDEVHQRTGVDRPVKLGVGAHRHHEPRQLASDPLLDKPGVGRVGRVVDGLELLPRLLG